MNSGVNSDLEATAAAHYIFSLFETSPESGNELAAELFRSVTHTSSTTRLLVAAHAVEYLDEPDVDRIESLVHELCASLSTERLEILATLLSNVSSRDKRPLMTLVTMRALDIGLEEVYAWPWLDAWQGYDDPTAEELDDLILGSAAEVESAIFYLSGRVDSDDWDGCNADISNLSAEAVAQLSERAQTLPDGKTFQRLLRVCGALGITAVLDRACQLAESGQETSIQLRWTSGLKYGHIHTCPLETVLLSIGRLGMACDQRGELMLRHRAYHLLDNFDTSRLHPSVKRGRLIALARMGDWPKLLSGLHTDDPPLHDAARQAILEWAPGPYAPHWGEDREKIVAWIVQELALREKEHAPDVRSTLSEIKESLQRETKKHVIVQADSSGED